MHGPSKNPVLDAIPRNLMIVVSPGTAFGAGEGTLRVSLVPTEADCREAVERWARVT